MAKATPPAPVPKTFGDRLHAARLARNLSVNELGIASELGFKVVQSLESGSRVDPPASEIIALCKALNMSADELLGLKPLPLVPDPRSPAQSPLRHRRVD